MWGEEIVSILQYCPSIRYPYFDVVAGLRGQRIFRAMPAVGQLLAGAPMPDRSKVMTQTKRYTLVLQVRGWVWV
jgi:hypothetical protein